MTEAIALRAMAREDVPQVVAIEERSFAPGWSERSFRAELDLPFSRSWVAHEASRPREILGYVVRWLVGAEMHLLDLAVRPEARRHGVGRILVDAVLAEAHAEGACVLLEVEEANHAARRLYAAEGFVETGRRRAYYGPGRDALMLEKRNASSHGSYMRPGEL